MQSDTPARLRLACLKGALCTTLVAGASCLPQHAVASRSSPDLCRDAARDAASQTGVPYAVLLAIALTETGGGRGSSMDPWPWAVHHAGRGHWLDTLDQAADLASRALADGATNIDLGCFQLNVRWHAQGFESVQDMLSPDRNATYAAGFLADLYRKSGDWSVAAGQYHSRDTDTAERYRAKFDTILASLSQDGTAMIAAMPAPDPALRANGFPLLQTGAPGGFGSLVPVLPSGARLVGG